jgi:hypothetical protein
MGRRPQSEAWMTKRIHIINDDGVVFPPGGCYSGRFYFHRFKHNSIRQRQRANFFDCMSIIKLNNTENNCVRLKERSSEIGS